jgi:hypothetical protein
MTNCQYAQECVNNNNIFWCSKCKHNGDKKNFYEPVHPDRFEPFKPHDSPYKPWIWPERFDPIFLNHNCRYETEYKLGPDTIFKLGPHPNIKVKTPRFLD